MINNKNFEIEIFVSKSTEKYDIFNKFNFPYQCIRLISVTITAKLTSEGDKGQGGNDVLNEPESWWLRKKKSLEKFNRRARRNCRKAVKSQVMFWLIIMLVFLNTCVLATEHYRQPKWLDHFQDVTNLFFVILFTCEMLVKMYALGLQVLAASYKCLNRLDY